MIGSVSIVFSISACVESQTFSFLYHFRFPFYEGSPYGGLGSSTPVEKWHLENFSSCVHLTSFWNVKLHKPAKFHDGIIFCTIVVITDRTRVDRLMKAVMLLWGSRKKVTGAKCATHAPKNSTHAKSITHARLLTQNYLLKYPLPTQIYPRPTTHDPRSFSNPHNPRNPRNCHTRPLLSQRRRHFLLTSSTLS